MTSLSQQLQRLSAPQLQVLREDRKRVSFLFPPAEAAKLDRHTVWTLGKNGLEDLIEIDVSFSSFLDSLFAQTSIQIQRAVLTKEENEKLDESIDRFLVLLTPYFLLKPAQQALEWLICRFNVHQYNMARLIHMALPYHDSNMFIRLVQILDISENDKEWCWLVPFQKSGVAPTRQILLNHATSSPHFIAAIAKHLQRAIQLTHKQSGEERPKKSGNFQLGFSFYVSIVVGVLETSEKVTDKLISALMPYIVSGLRSHVGSFKLASLMIISQLSLSVTLVPSVVESLLHLVISKMKNSTARESIKTAIVLCQTQNVPKYPKKVVKRIAEKWVDFSLRNVVDELNDVTELESFLLPFMEELIRVSFDGSQSYSTQALAIVTELCTGAMVLSGSVAKGIFGFFLGLFKENLEDGDHLRKFRMAFEDICIRFTRRHPSEFDSVCAKEQGRTESFSVKEEFFRLCEVPSGASAQKTFSTTDKSEEERAIGDAVPSDVISLVPDVVAEPPAKRKRRQKEEDEEAKKWREETKKLESNFTQINPDRLKPLFDLLDISLNPEGSIPNKNYVQQLIISSITAIFMDDKAMKNISEDRLRIDVVVRAIRSTDNSATLQESLKLLVAVAKKFQSQVLVHIMSVFTFMGTGLVRKDDQYSFQVVYQTIEAVLPAIVESGDGGGVGSVMKVLRVFVVALPDIPPHRRVGLMWRLVDKSSSTSSSLWILLALLLEAYVSRWNQIKETVDQEEEFMVELFSQFSGEQQLAALLRLWQYILYLSSDLKKQNPKKEVWPTIFDTKSHSAQKLRHYRYVTMGVTIKVLTGEDLIQKLSEGELPEEVKKMCAELIDVGMRNLILATNASDSVESTDSDKKYWRAISQRCELCLKKLNGLFPVDVLLCVLEDLLSRDSMIIRRSGLDLLNSKLLQHPTPFTQQHVPKLSQLTNKISDWLVIRRPLLETDMMMVQSVAYSLKLLAKVVGPLDPDAFIQAFEHCTVLLHDWRDLGVLLLGNVILCLGELVCCLGPKTLPKLSIFLPDLLNLLTANRGGDGKEMLLLGVLTGVQRVVEKLGGFLSPHLPLLLLHISRVPSSPEVSGVGSHVPHRLLQIKKHLAALPFRTLFPGIKDAYTTLHKKHPDSLAFIFDVLMDHMDSIEEENLSSLTSFHFNALDLRCELKENALTPSEVNKIEDPILNSMVKMSLKLSETRFRPLMFKLTTEWVSNSMTETTEKGRWITLFRLSSKLAEELKGLFLLFAGHLIKLASQLLIKTNFHFAETNDLLFPKSKDNTAVLLDAVLDCLEMCGRYDSRKFFTTDRFSLLLQPLIDHLENIELPGFSERVEKRLIPAVTTLSVCVGEEGGCWKKLNYQLLLKTRSKRPSIRCSVLKTVQALYRKLGEDVTPMVPETVPFLAELMEDGNEEVEEQCHQVVKTLEEIIGESLQQYF